jgi:hsp70-interacting protein
MDSLLRWSIEHSTPRSADAPPPARKDLDPGIIDLLLGKQDAVLMREALEVALDEKRGEEARMWVLDDLEMLVERVDNTNSTSCLFAARPRSSQTRS